jgi:hypothetical protein
MEALFGGRREVLLFKEPSCHRAMMDNSNSLALGNNVVKASVAYSKTNIKNRNAWLISVLCAIYRDNTREKKLSLNFYASPDFLGELKQARTRACVEVCTSSNTVACSCDT